MSKKQTATSRKKTARKKAAATSRTRSKPAKSRKSASSTNGRAPKARRPATSARARKAPARSSGKGAELATQLRSIRRMRSEEKVETLSGMLSEVMDRFRFKDITHQIIEELGRTNDPRAVEVLSFALNNACNADTRTEVVRALATFRMEDAIRPLGRIALSKEIAKELRLVAVKAISKNLGEKVWLTLARVLSGAIEQGDKELQAGVIEAIRKADGRAVPVLLRALDSEEEEERMFAATALGVTGDRAVLDSLRTTAMSAEEEALREAAAKAAILLYCT
jgi:HEAT repeat protein